MLHSILPYLTISHPIHILFTSYSHPIHILFTVFRPPGIHPASFILRHSSCGIAALRHRLLN